MINSRLFVVLLFLKKHWWRFLLGCSVVILIVWLLTHFSVFFTKLSNFFVHATVSKSNLVEEADAPALAVAKSDDGHEELSDSSDLPIEKVALSVPPKFYICVDDGIYTSSGFVAVGQEVEGFQVLKVSRRFGQVVFLRIEDDKIFSVSFGRFGSELLPETKKL